MAACGGEAGVLHAKSGRRDSVAMASCLEFMQTGARQDSVHPNSLDGWGSLPQTKIWLADLLTRPGDVYLDGMST